MTPTIRSLVATLAGLLLGALPGAPVTAQHFPPDEDVVPMLRYLVEDGATVGIVLALRDSDGSTRILTYGSGGEGARALGAESVFEIGSITKTFTGVLLADMVMRGEVSLRDPVSRYLPAHVRMPSWRGHEITLLDLATHRSGLPRMPDNGDPCNPGDGFAGYGVEDLYEFLSDHQLRHAPGEEAEYSNVGFGLLGHLLERASGQSYEDMVAERILKPLGMHMTWSSRPLPRRGLLHLRHDVQRDLFCRPVPGLRRHALGRILVRLEPEPGSTRSAVPDALVLL